MKELIKIQKRNNQNLVDARELHQFLENKRQFADWVKQRIEQYGFIQNQDYSTYSQNCEKGRPSIEYGLTIDMAKELSMVENNDKGRKARRYFIEMEKKAILKNYDYVISDLSDRVNTLEQQARQKTLKEAAPIGPVGKRLDGLLKHYHLNKNSLSVKLGISSNSVITRIVNDRKRGMSLKNIQRILLTFPDINPEWLILGKGRMLKKKPVDAMGKELALFQ